MNYELIVDEEECVTFGLVRCCNHLFLFFIGQLWEIINHLESVSSIGHAEAEFEIIRFDTFSTEVMSLYH